MSNVGTLEFPRDYRGPLFGDIGIAEYYGLIPAVLKGNRLKLLRRGATTVGERLLPRYVWKLRSNRPFARTL